ncbi:MAG TPA: hypothetical protein PK910_06300 [Bacteroidales bacterium]|nr:hypothetical protein [Bacteroidales bacterium]
MPPKSASWRTYTIAHIYFSPFWGDREGQRKGEEEKWRWDG